MRASPVGRRLVEQTSDDARGERTKLGGELDARCPSVGQRTRTGCGACESAGDRGERVGVAGHRGRKSRSRARARRGRQPTTARAAATVDSACWSSDTVARIASRSSVELATSPPRISDAIASATIVAAWTACVDACVTAASSAGNHRTPHRIVREHEAGGDGAAERALAERPGSRLEPRQTRTPLFDRRDDRPARDAQPAHAPNELRSLTIGAAPTPLASSASAEMTSCCTPGAHLAVRAVEALALEPLGRHELGRARADAASSRRGDRARCRSQHRAVHRRRGRAEGHARAALRRPRCRRRAAGRGSAGSSWRPGPRPGPARQTRRRSSASSSGGILSK